MNLLKSIVFTLVMPCTLVAYVPWWILGGAGGGADGGAGAEAAGMLPVWLRAVGVVPMAAGVGIYLWCVWEFVKGQGTPAPIDPPKELVVGGLYRFTRNPMYVGMTSILTAEAILFSSAVMLGYAAAAFVVFHLFILGYEEPTLRKKFGESYEAYCRTVPRWVGRV